MKRKTKQYLCLVWIVILTICAICLEELRIKSASFHHVREIPNGGSDTCPLSSESLRRNKLSVEKEVAISELLGRRSGHRFFQTERKNTKKSSVPGTGFYLLAHRQDVWGIGQDINLREDMLIEPAPIKEIISYIHNQDGEK